MKPCGSAIGQATVPRFPSGTRNFCSQPIEELKKQRLKLKDEIVSFLTKVERRM
jgi:uncharacterized protein YdcH (DUF465 family)